MNSRILLLVILALAAGCGYDVNPNTDDSMAMQCDIAPFRSVVSDTPISCRNLSVNVAIFRDLLEQSRLMDNDVSFAKYFSPVEVHLGSGTCLQGSSSDYFDPGQCLHGTYGIKGGSGEAGRKFAHLAGIPFFLPAGAQFHVELSHDGRQLGHMMLHHYDEMTGYFTAYSDGVSVHPDWYGRRLETVLRDYESMAQPLN